MNIRRVRRWLTSLGFLTLVASTLSFDTPRSVALEPVEVTGCTNTERSVYVALGASDAVGVGATSAKDGWVPRLHQRMPTSTRLLNLGESGTLLSEAVRRQVPRAVAARPTVATVWLAVNDFRAQVPLTEYSRDLDRTLAALRGTGAKVYVGNVPDISLLPIIEPELRLYLRAQIMQWNEEIERIARKNDAEVVDLFSMWVELEQHPEYISGDGFHPSDQGYRRLADVFWDSMRPSLNREPRRAS